MDDSYGCCKDYCFILIPLVSNFELAKVEDTYCLFMFVVLLSCITALQDTIQSHNLKNVCVKHKNANKVVTCVVVMPNLLGIFSLCNKLKSDQSFCI